jgi:hypothetical protein
MRITRSCEIGNVAWLLHPASEREIVMTLWALLVDLQQAVRCSSAGQEIWDVLCSGQCAEKSDSPLMGFKKVSSILFLFDTPASFEDARGQVKRRLYLDSGLLIHIRPYNSAG